MKKASKRIILSVITLVFVVVALGTTTFAWFTLSNTATVGNIEGTVQAGDGLEVAITASAEAEPTTGFKTNLTTTDINAVLSTYTNFSFGAVSTTDAVSFTGMQTNGTDVISGDTFTVFENNLVPVKNEENSFLEFDLWFKSDTAGTVNWTDFTLDGTVPTFTTDVDFIGADGNAVNAGHTVTENVSNSARIALFDSTGNLVDSVQKEAGSGNIVNTTVQWDGQYSYLFAKGNVVKVGSDLLVQDPGTSNLTGPTTLPTFHQAGTAINTPAVAILTAGVAEKVTVRIWLEGWDVNMFDAILETTLTTTLTFEKA